MMHWSHWRQAASCVPEPVVGYSICVATDLSWRKIMLRPLRANGNSSRVTGDVTARIIQPPAAVSVELIFSTTFFFNSLVLLHA
jgi:hypothetical protein